MKTNYQKIKKLIETGFMVEAKIEKDYIIFSSVTSGESIRGSCPYDSIGECLDNLGEVLYTEQEINRYKFDSLTPIPHLYKPMQPGELVDILDTPELREICKDYSEMVKRMIGQEGLEVKGFILNNHAHSYKIWKKDKNDWFIFPVWAVVPHLEDDEVIELTLEDIAKLKGVDVSRIKIKK